MHPNLVPNSLSVIRRLASNTAKSVEALKALARFVAGCPADSIQGDEKIQYKLTWLTLQTIHLEYFNTNSNMVKWSSICLRGEDSGGWSVVELNSELQ